MGPFQMRACTGGSGAAGSACFDLSAVDSYNAARGGFFFKDDLYNVLLC